MHALHSLAHRAPPATRTRVRWQPYTSIPVSSCSSSSSRSSPLTSYLNTPASSVSSSPQIATPTCDVERIRQILPSAAAQLKDPLLRDSHRNKHTSSLVDQAVKSLCEIWRPQDIPPVFIASARSMVTGGATYEHNPIEQKPSTRNRTRNTQLPSPVSPSTLPSPTLTASSSSPSPSTLAQVLPLSEQDIASTHGTRSNLVPIKAFVHEVLRRSRTSGCVLQTALCYLEAIRAKVPELVQQEHSGDGVKGEPDLGDRVTIATPAELERESEFAMSLDSVVSNDACTDDDLMATVRIYDNGPDNCLDNLASSSHASNDPASQKLPPGPALPSLPPLPSPLLCPRRAFLASLILASKFTQDKCYSNRAWAKLSGLPPREIGRCERALGEALEWRLWVGKQPSAAAPQAPSPPLLPSTNRPVVRSHSEGSLFTTTPAQHPFMVQDEKCIASLPGSSISTHRGLRRCATLPTEAYVAPAPVPIDVPLDHPPWRTSNPTSSCSSDLSENDMYYPDQMSLAETYPLKPMDLCPSTSACSQYTEKISLSPSPQTPGLSYSPSSTESCSGDRTIQMSSFLDDSMGTFNSGHLGISSSESWPWLDTSDIAPCLQKTPLHTTNVSHKHNPIFEHFGPMPSVAGYASSLPFQVPLGAGADAVGCLWPTEKATLMYPLPS
ncbi:hypothetical protein FPV67DRAFT_1033891 [Lyophyllum atratum]|nr:hypothetical protein FPV67DRAFT_1033891 [Lyophyllum atratum]